MNNRELTELSTEHSKNPPMKDSTQKLVERELSHFDTWNDSQVIFTNGPDLHLRTLDDLSSLCILSSPILGTAPTW